MDKVEEIVTCICFEALNCLFITCILSKQCNVTLAEPHFLITGCRKITNIVSSACKKI